MGPKNAAGGAPKPRSRLNSEEVRLTVKAVNVLSNVAERFGVAFAVLLLTLFAPWLMGTAQTRDDFIRELLFGSVTQTRYLSVYFVFLVIVAVSGFETRLRAFRTERAEMARLAAEKAFWQEKALGTKLSHTAEAEEERV
jgi:hypothetical protein